MGVCLPPDINSCPRHAPQRHGSPTATAAPPSLAVEADPVRGRPTRGSLALGRRTAASRGHEAPAPATDAPRGHAHASTDRPTLTHLCIYIAHILIHVRTQAHACTYRPILAKAHIPPARRVNTDNSFRCREMKPRQLLADKNLLTTRIDQTHGNVSIQCPTTTNLIKSM